MDHRDLLSDAARRPVDSATVVLDAIGDATLHAMPADRCGSIAWLVWHAARQADVQLAHLRDAPEVWDATWQQRLGVTRGTGDFGFGDTADAVRALTVTDAGALLGYLTAVMDALIGYVDTLSADDLDDIVDTRWTPAVSRGVRLVSIIDDAVAHLGQAGYVRGLVEGWSIGY